MDSRKEFYALGLMSGTSLYGLDIAYVKFIFEKNKIIHFNFIETEHIPYEKNLRYQLHQAHLIPSIELLKLDVLYGKWLGQQVNLFKQKYKINKIDIVGSHGHTIFHQPQHGFTLQIGNGAHICSVSKENIVCDFRSENIAWGGQGAPLVPIGDEILFPEYNACLNLGGFANISFQYKEKNRIAFDICPVNFVLNHLSEKLGLPYDDKGNIASENKINKDLLNKLNQIHFYQEIGPKSLGREWVEKEIFPLIYNTCLSTKDLISTFTHHIAIQLAYIIKKYSLKNVLITGGGAYNNFLILSIKRLTNSNLVIPSPQLIDFKESLIFALLATLKVNNQINILSSVTGAKINNSSGVIYQFS